MPGASRVARILGAFDPDWDALLISDPVNVRYVAGWPELVGGAYLISPDQILSAMDRRYAMPETPRIGFDDLEPADLRSIAVVLRDFHGVLAYEDQHLTVSDLAEIENLLDGRGQLASSNGLIESLREVKGGDEIELIEKAANIADAVLAYLAELEWTGNTERQIMIAAEERMLQLGADGPAFPTMVTCAPGNAMPHGMGDATVIGPGSLVLVDLGVRFEGYASDITRMYSVGRPDSDVLHHYALLLDAQERGIAAIKAGANSRSVDAAARDALSAAGLGEYFGHGLGHGVGVRIHESPRLSPLVAGRPLEAGNVVTVEPGLYFPDNYGLRVEDLVVVTADGARVLSQFPKAEPVIVS
jgi:Xaa-Pro aminopeptidase